MLKSLAQCLASGWQSVNIIDDDECDDNIDVIRKPELNHNEKFSGVLIKNRLWVQNLIVTLY